MYPRSLASSFIKSANVPTLSSDALNIDFILVLADDIISASVIKPLLYSSDNTSFRLLSPVIDPRIIASFTYAFAYCATRSEYFTSPLSFLMARLIRLSIAESRLNSILSNTGNPIYLSLSLALPSS